MPQPRRPGRWLLTTAVVAAVGMFVVNAVGFLDTETGSALGCGSDWPLCNGQVIPALTNLHVLIEFAHRALVGGFALIAFGFVVAAYLRYRAWVEVRWLAAIGVGFTLIQSVLGALAVLFVNPPEVLALHLGFGLLAMVGVGLLAVFLFQMAREASGAGGLSLRRRGAPDVLRRWLWAGWGGLYVLLYWGSLVAFVGAGPACPGWPLCGGWQWGTVGTLAALNLIHRLLALAYFVLTVAIWRQVGRVAPDRPDLGRAAGWQVLLTAFQGWTGANLVWNHLATGPDLLHVTVVMGLFTLASYQLLQAFPYRQPETAWRRAAEPRPTS
ncbi:MAG: COX15/CtaA family protein [Firmicutes bacterium]|nr:COX15/CtaA family protein [Alicyclobacillaceae bacterium]MCL6497353.1 COX15/CtaA family protein [Bacillota bacterium]